MKRKIIMILAAALAIVMIAAAFAPLLFAETVQRTFFLPDIPPLAVNIVLYAALCAVALLVIVRIVLSFIKKK